jgi:hypothetical protein
MRDLSQQLISEKGDSVFLKPYIHLLFKRIRVQDCNGPQNRQSLDAVRLVW